MTATDWIWGELKPLHYGLIHADPPWSFETYSEAGRDRSADYRTMSIDEIAALPVKDLARPDCLVALWAIDSLLAEAFAVLEAWGFRYVTTAFTWVKTFDVTSQRVDLVGRALERGDWNDVGAAMAPMGLGYWTRANPEICLLASLGSPARLEKAVRQLILAPKREHSRKPDEAARRLERLAPGPRCELFARERRPGWDCWGNQVDLFSQGERG